MRYLLDTNTFIEAKNRYYGMNICPGFWDWLLAKNASGDIYSITMVRKELEKGNDELKTWAQVNDQIFELESDEATQESYSKIAEYSMGLSDLKTGAQAEFLAVADSWLIAKAKATSSVLVTHEQFNLKARKKILMPNICEEFDVRWMNTFDLLNELEAEFILRKN